MPQEIGKSIDPVEERDITKFLALLEEPRCREALFDLMETEYEKYLESKGDAK